MSGQKATTERNAAGRNGERVRLRWTRVATLAAVLLLHLGFFAFLLASPSGWRWASPETPSASPDALLVRLLPAPPRPAETPRASPSYVPRQVRAMPSPRRAPPVALPARPTAQAAPQAALRSIDSLIATTPSSYVAGGGRLAGADYGRQNVRVPGSGAPVRGMPVFRMADPRMQGVAGAIRVIGRLVGGAVDPHCLQVDGWQGMSPQERIAHHVDADEAQMAAIAERYHCPDPLKPGAAMYYFTHFH